VFTARYALSPYIKQIRFVFKGLISVCAIHFISKVSVLRFILQAVCLSNGQTMTEFCKNTFIFTSDDEKYVSWRFHSLSFSRHVTRYWLVICYARLGVVDSVHSIKKLFYFYMETKVYKILFFFHVLHVSEIWSVIFKAEHRLGVWTCEHKMAEIHSGLRRLQVSSL
jgi:hypothetical protein